MLQKVFVADLDPERLAARTARPSDGRPARPRRPRAWGRPRPGPGPGTGAAAGVGTAASARHRDGRRAVRVGIVCPYTWAVPGGVQQHIRDLAEALIGLGHEVSVISPADDDTPLPAYVVPGGPRRPGALQRVGGPAGVRVPVRQPRPALGQGGRVRRAARARAGRAQPVPAGLLGGGRADRGHRAHRHHAIAGHARLRAGPADRAGEGQRMDRGLRGRAHHPGRAHRRRRGADPERGDRQPVREGQPAARLARGRRRARLPGPDGRAAQGPGRAAARVRRAGRRSGPDCGC